MTTTSLFPPSALAQSVGPSKPASPGLDEPQPAPEAEQPFDAGELLNFQQELAASQAAHYQEKWEERWAPIEPGTYAALPALSSSG